MALDKHSAGSSQARTVSRAILVAVLTSAPVAAMLLGLWLYLASQLENQRQRLNTLIQADAQMVDANSIKTEFMQAHQGVYQALTLAKGGFDEKDVDACLKKSQSLIQSNHQRIDNLAKSGKLPQDVATALEKSSGAVTKYSRIVNACVISIKADADAAIVTMTGAAKFYGEVESALSNASEALQKIKSSEVEQAKESLKSFEGYMKTAMLGAGIATAILGICIACWIAFFIQNKLVNPVAKILGTMKSLESGNLTEKCDVQQSDEIGELAGALNQTSGNLRNIIREISTNSNTVAGTANELDETAKQLASGSVEMEGQAQSVASAGEQLSANMKAMAGSADHIRSAVDEVSRSVQQMTHSIEEVTSNCTKESQIAETATEQANHARKVISDLGESAQAIGKIVELINSIAKQTNLLALNATIEAASAGEAGKGFAVVANEVKALARQSAEATEKIEQQIQAIQSDTNNSIEEIQRVSKTIEEVAHISHAISIAVDRQNSAAQAISQNIIHVASSSTELSRRIEESAKASTEVSQNIQGVSACARESATQATKANHFADDLALQADKLRNIVAKFKI